MPRPDLRLLLLATPLLLAALPGPARAAQILPLPAVDSPQGGGGAVVLEPVPVRASVSRRTIFTCITPQLVTYSDRPCGPLADTRELRTVTPTGGDALAAATRQEPVPEAPQRHDDAAGTVDSTRAREQACEQLEAAVTELDQVMRAGYSAREAGRLWERWRAAKARLRESGC